MSRPVSRSAAEVPLLGLPSSVLSAKWIERYASAEQSSSSSTGSSVLPFKLPPKLPTREEVLKLYWFLRQNDQDTKKKKIVIVDTVVGEILSYWRMSNIKTLTPQNVQKKVLSLVDEYEARRKCFSRKGQQEEERRKTFTQSLTGLFDIASKDAESFVQKDRLLGGEATQEDLEFLKDQRGDRKMCMDGRDKLYDEAVDKKRKREENAKNLVEMERKRAEETKVVDIDKICEESNNAATSSANDEVKEDTDDEDFVFQEPRKKKGRVVSVEMPKNPFSSPHVTSTMDRLKVSSRTAAGMFAAFMKTGSSDGQPVDLNDFNMSRSTVESTRKKNRGVLVEMVRDEFEEKKPKYLNIHWDGKLVPNVMGKKEEREAIFVSGAPHYLEGKLLDVSKLESSSGLSQFEGVKEQVKIWDIKNQIRSFTFDTTGSNTGVKVGCCKRLQDWLGRPVLWLGCRHHIGELIAKAVWYTLFEEDLEPENKFFASIRKQWESIDTSPGATIRTLDGSLAMREEALQFYEKVIKARNDKNEILIRDDYREIVETAMMILGKPPRDSYVWKKPGACHKARFCAFGIYIHKAVAFSDQLGLEEDFIESLVRVANFFSTIYVPYFMKASVGCDAAINDLEMFHMLEKFGQVISFKIKIHSFKMFVSDQVDEELAHTARTVLGRHTWYLQQETVPMALFSDKLSDDQKSRLAVNILMHESDKPNMQDFKLSKPTLKMNITPETKLHDLVAPRSFLFWSILGLGYDWLKKSVSDWSSDEAYLEARNYVRTVKVTNDVAERGIKVIIQPLNVVMQVTDYYFFSVDQ